VCGRYTLTAPDPAQVRARFGLDERIEVRPRFNIAPTDEVLAVTTDRDGRPRGEMLRWGLVPPWSRSAGDGAKMINARAETLGERPAFRGAFERFRCLIPADGFYEWRVVPGQRTKQPMYIRLRGGDLFGLAGLYAEGRGPEGEPLRTCAIVTCTPNELMAGIHDRMPVLLRPEDEALWLDADLTAPEAVISLLQPYPAEAMEAMPVSTLVNDVRHDGPALISPVVAA
jgi:putative SOS response-associated peptidase YedK